MPKYSQSKIAEAAFRKILGEFENEWQYRHERAILEITESIAREMESKGVSRASLANTLGVSRAYITQLLGGKPDFTLGTLFKVADALGMSPTISFARLRSGRGKTRQRSHPSQTPRLVVRV